MSLLDLPDELLNMILLFSVCDVRTTFICKRLLKIYYDNIHTIIFKETSKFLCKSMINFDNIYSCEIQEGFDEPALSLTKNSFDLLLDKMKNIHHLCVGNHNPFIISKFRPYKLYSLLTCNILNVDYSHLRYLLIHENIMPIYEKIPLQCGVNIIPMVSLPTLECLVIKEDKKFYEKELLKMDYKSFPKLSQMIFAYFRKSFDNSRRIIENFDGKIMCSLYHDTLILPEKNMKFYIENTIKHKIRDNNYIVTVYGWHLVENKFTSEIIYRLELPLK
jgi:hypothetical protein